MPRTTVALVGNPNAGKSTLFNALSGGRAHVGNYPGVTVELLKGALKGADGVELIDLPGTYSLAARSPDEMVAVDLLLGRRPEEPRPDVVLNIVDASNLDRHLYLTSQLLELGAPVVVALNMTDVAEGQGVKIDADALSRATGVPVVRVQANKGAGLEQLRAALLSAAGAKPPLPVPLPEALEAEATALDAAYPGELPRFLARRLLLDVGGYVETWMGERHGAELAARVADARARLKEAGSPVPACEARARFAWVRGVVGAAVTKPPARRRTFSDRLDGVLTHRVWGTLLFLLLMFAVFQAIYAGAEPLMEIIDGGTQALAERVRRAVAPGALQSLLADGVVTGVGGVVKFLPQILILFGFVAVLEDCGYMARAAYLMDRLMSRCGLSGKSFIPMLSSVACAVPGVMATRVIENRRDRLATMVVAPLMSCSARLPVYALLIGAFLTEGFAWYVPGLVLFGMYMVGFVAAPLVALALRKTVLRGDRGVFVMELPAYKRPSVRAVVRRMAQAGGEFLRRAGTLILATMIVVWASMYYPTHDAEGRSYPNRLAAMADDDDARNPLEAEWRANSYLGRTGHALEPVFRPLGWDWKLGMAALASFPAREVIVGTLGILYEQGEVDVGDDGQRDELGKKVREDWERDPVRGRYGVPVALSVMVFFALCLQCASTLAVIRRESRSWRWPLFTFAYMTALAYLGALVTFQVGRLVVDWVG